MFNSTALQEILFELGWFSSTRTELTENLLLQNSWPMSTDQSLLSHVTEGLFSKSFSNTSVHCQVENARYLPKCDILYMQYFIIFITGLL